jgi:hypothetical protein
VDVGTEVVVVVVSEGISDGVVEGETAIVVVDGGLLTTTEVFPHPLNKTRQLRLHKPRRREERIYWYGIDNEWRIQKPDAPERGIRFLLKLV